MKFSTFFIAPLLIAVSSAAVLKPEARAAAPDPAAFHVKDAILESPSLKNLPPKTVDFLRTVPVEVFDQMTQMSATEFLAALGELAEGRIPKLSTGTATSSIVPTSAATLAARYETGLVVPTRAPAA
ncbi:hypothetical protein ABW21_db0206482 [Orbilia brochopaga]|nr:hypothetical protein ABW21_db0206482 [Drechslerella brochopaga]